MINYEMALSEIEMYKKAHESLSENLTHANKKAQQFKTERDTLIDDLSWYKAKVSRLEQRHSKLVDENTRLQNELYAVGLNQDEADEKIKGLERVNEKLRKANSNGWKQKDELNNKLISNVKSKDNLLSEISQHIGNKPSSSTYKYFRGKLNALEIREDE
ncbi:hypothetical protein U9L70_10610 [Staphylococcus equorum]|uniref:hypothetical protein n=1 Tax=Staphylococcus equorum TaxID=246432 RepID=UPI00397FD93B